MEDVEAIRAALEARLAQFDGRPEIAWENVNFVPVNGVPYWSTFLLLAEPEDQGNKDSPYLQRGYLQIGLHYPSNKGPGEAQAKAVALRDFFKRGNSFEAGGITTVVERTPEITGGSNEDQRYVIRVRVRFFARIDPA